MTHHDEIDYPALHETFLNGNRDDAAAIIRSSDNPAWSVLRLLREMARFGEPAHLLDDVVNLQGLTEYRCISPIEDALAELDAIRADQADRDEDAELAQTDQVIRILRGE